MKRKLKTPSSKVVTKPLSENKLIVRCVYSSPVVVVAPATGTKYRLEPGQTKTIADKRDYDHLLSLARNPGRGCCGHSDENRHYFEAVEN